MKHLQDYQNEAQNNLFNKLGAFFAFGDDEKGPPFKTNIDTLHRHFEKYFTLEWERRPKRFFPTREGQEWLMCWSRK